MAVEKSKEMLDISDYYVLISCVNREFCTELYPTYEAAFAGMLKDIKDVDVWKEEGWGGFYEKNKDENGCCEEHDDFGIHKMSAWINSPYDDTAWDWEIESVAELLKNMKGRESTFDVI